MKIKLSYIIKVDRIAAWVLAGGIVLYFISGYGLTKGFISPEMANRLHIHDLAVLVLIAFTVHTSIAISFALKRWNIWGPATKFLLASFYVLFLGFFVYVGNFYQKPAVTALSASQISSNDTTQSANSSRTFTMTELAKYNGQKGQPAYVAVDGIVYDLSSVFISGYHFGYQAGQDLSVAFHSRHYSSILDRYPVVGTLQH